MVYLILKEQLNGGWFHLQEAIENSNGEVERFLEQMKAHVNLNEPINENAAHFAGNIVAVKEPECIP